VDPSTPRFLRLLLRLYPRRYRVRYGTEMEAFHRQSVAAGEAGPGYWVGVAVDHLRAAAAVRRGGGDGMTRTFLADLLAAVRSLRRAGSFTVFSVLTLALGIGATTAVFSVVDRVLLRPLPYPGSERMALVGIRSRMNPEARGPLSAPLMSALADDPGPAEAVVSAGGREMIFQDGGDPERLPVTRVSEGFFSFFGARARVGRLLNDEDQAPGAQRAAVLGHGFWQDRYGADPSVVGRTIRLNDEPYTVVGVLDRDFVPPPEITEHDQMWIPLRLREGDPDRGSFFMVGAARLRPGATVAEMEARVAQVVEDVYPPGAGPNFVTGGAAEDFQSTVVGPVAATLGRVLGAVGLLLLIACVNVASLLLTRGTQRIHELSVRTALGAGRGRLLRQLLSESLVLAVAGGALGSGLAFGSVELFRHYAPAGLPRLPELAVDVRGLAFAMALAVVTVLLFGLLPALRSTRRAGAPVIDMTRRGSPGRREGRLRGGLVALETALAVVLAVGSGLLARDLVRMTRSDPGFRPEGVVSMRVNLRPRYERDEWTGMWSRFVEGARTLPGVTAAAVATQVPYSGDRIASTYRPEGVSGEDAEGVFVITVAAGGDYLQSLGARIVEGRAFGATDDGSAPTALVNEAFVHRFWPGVGGVGKRVRSGRAGVDDEPDYQVVGVLADVVSRPGQDVSPMLLLPIQEQPWSDMEVVARTDGDVTALAAALRDLARTLDPELPVTSVRTVASLGREALARPRFYTTLFGGFAAVALLLALVGVYGTTAYATRSRTREIGIRMALGARRTGVVGAVVGGAGIAVGAGVVLGLGAAALASRAMVDVLHKVDPRDLIAYAAVGVLVLGAGLIAAWIPAAQAGRVDPAQTLRQDG
jgi:predicted permease